MATVRIYGIFFNDSKYVYIGSTKRDPCQRFAEHQREAERGILRRFKHNVWHKHGVRKFVVFKQTTDETRRLELEQAYYDFFARHGWYLVNDTSPVVSKCSDYTFMGNAEYKQRLSTGMKAAFASPEARQRMSKASKEALNRPEVRAKLRESQRRAHDNPISKERRSNGVKRALASPEVRQKMSKHIKASRNTEQSKQKTSVQTKQLWSNADYHDKMRSIMRATQNRPELKQHLAQKRKETWSDPAYKQRMHDMEVIQHRFRKAYGTAQAYRYRLPTNKFEPWMSFIIQPDDNVIVFVWDTRKVLFQCKKSDLPDGYQKAKDNHMPLIFD